MSRSILFATLLSAAGLALLGGCATGPETSGQVSYPPDPNLLRVAVSPDSRPIIFKQNGRIAGLDAELARMLGEELGREVVFVERPFEGLVDALDNDEADLILSNLSITGPRQMRMAFTLPYLPSGQMALARRTDLRGDFRNATEVIMTNRVVAVERATTGQYFVESLFENAKVRSFRHPADAAEAIIAGNADVLIHDAPVVWRLAGDYEAEGLAPLNSLLTREFIAGAVALGNSELLGEVNAALEKWTNDGTLNELARRWAPFLFIG